MADGDLVRRITISATGENLDSTTSQTLALGAATATLTTLTDEAAKRASDAAKAYDTQTESIGSATNANRSFGGALKTAAEIALEATAAYYAKAAALRVVLSLLSTLVSILGVLYVAYKVITSAIDLIAQAWKLGGDELKKYTDLNTNAATVSVDFYQRITKAAVDAKLPVDELVASFKTLNDATAEQLGGSPAQKRLDELVKAGNFNGNTGVAAFENAQGPEAKARATLNLLKQASEAGERLAGLDFSKTVFGAGAAANLSKNQDYMASMLRAADAIDGKTLVSKESVDNAIALQLRMDAATTILEKRWHPIQTILIGLGVSMHEAWVNTVSAIARIDRHSGFTNDLIADS